MKRVVLVVLSVIISCAAPGPGVIAETIEYVTPFGGNLTIYVAPTVDKSTAITRASELTEKSLVILCDEARDKLCAKEWSYYSAIIQLGVGNPDKNFKSFCFILLNGRGAHYPSVADHSIIQSAEFHCTTDGRLSLEIYE
jgi:hypothetical protein